MRSILFILFLATASFSIADENAQIVRERVLQPDSPDLIGQLRQIGFPKYTADEKRILARAHALQSKHDAAFKGVIIGRSVFEFDGLVAMGVMNYHPDQKNPYSLTIGIRPHIDFFSKSFREYRIMIDKKGIVQSKSVVAYTINNAEQGGAQQPATRPESKSE